MKKITPILTTLLLISLAMGCSSNSTEDATYSRTIFGRLQNPSGKAISQALITLDSGNGEFRNSRIDTVTNKDGEFNFRVGLAGPDLNLLIAEKGSPEVRVTANIRQGSESRTGLIISKSGQVVDLTQGIDVALIPSDNCKNVFIQEADVKQIAFTEDNCQVASSVVFSGSQTDNIFISATAERCPIEIDCPQKELSTIQNGLIVDLVTGINQDYCDYRVEYRTRDDKLLQTLKIRSAGDRLTRCASR